MTVRSTLLVLISASVVSLVFSGASSCWASLMLPNQPEFMADGCAGPNDPRADDDCMSPESFDPLADNDSPFDSLLNPIRLTARKGVVPTGSSSSGSSSSPSSGASGSTPLAIASDPEALGANERSEWLYADSTLLIPRAAQARLFRPPRLS